MNDPTSPLFNLGTWMIVIGSIPGPIFLFGYGLTAPWYRSAIGIMFVLLGLSLSIVAVSSTLTLVFGQNYPYREVVRVVLYTVYIAAVWSLMFTWLYERRHPYRTGPIFPRKDPELSRHEAESGLVWYPTKRALRTAFSTALILLPAIPEVLAIVNEAWPTEALAGVLAQSILLNAAVARVMALDRVNLILAKIGLGSAPQAVLEAETK